ncbi:MAG: adenylate/guanylate cyclase domain-containing protein [Gammaproteobacteria bacterium]
MDFDALLNDVTRLVRERGRVSLAAVGEYFDLTPQRLDAVRDELVSARGTLALENERILVLPDVAEEPPAEAERRNLTVMFVDLVGSSDLSGQLDPEELRDVIQRYQQMVVRCTERLHGYTAQYLGDGVLVYFGYPHAHDDDARRALYAAHDVLDQLSALNDSLHHDHGVRVDLRIGIHTGLVVVGDVGAGARHEALALGETPNIAARIESMAAPGTVMLSAATRGLLADQFELESQGDHELRGIAQPVTLYRSLRPSGVSSAFDLAVRHKLLPLAGRVEELAILTRAWNQAKTGAGSAIAVTGDAGIGKSRLIQALKDRLLENDERWTALRCSAYDVNTPMHPIIALLRQTIEIDPQDDPELNLRRIADIMSQFDTGDIDAVGIIAALCGVVRKDAPAVELGAASQLFESLFMQFLLQGPRLLVIEDVHWLDPTTMGMARRLIKHAPQSSLLVVVSARPGFDFQSLDSELERLRLGPLPRRDIESMIDSVTEGRALAPAVVTAIVQRTDGVPAFIEELTRMLLASDWLVERDGQLLPNGPPPDRIPATLTDSLMARLDRLGDAKAIAQEAAVIGRTFTTELLSAVSRFDQDVVDDALEALRRARIIRKRSRIGDENWRFRHALLQESAYQSLLRATRQTLHLKTAETIESGFQLQAAQHPERVARHFQIGGDASRALGYWQWAAEQAVEKAATREALFHVDEAMALLAELPESTQRDLRELSLITIKGSALILIGGWAAPGLADIYDRALALVARSGQGAHVDFQVLGGLCAYHLVRGELDTVSVLATRLLKQGRASDDAASLTVANVCQSFAAFFHGDFDAARRFANEVTLHYDPDTPVPVSFLYGQDPLVITQTMLALLTWSEGDTVESLKVSERAMQQARRVRAPFSALWADAWHARLLFECGDTAEAYALARVTRRECEKNDYGYVAGLSSLVVGAAAQANVAPEAGIDDLRAVLKDFSRVGNVLAHTYFNALCAAGELAVGDVDGARTVIDSALGEVGGGSEAYWRGELYRLRGELLCPSDALAASADFRAAVEEANRQGAHRLSLRAALRWHQFLPDELAAIEALRVAARHVMPYAQDPEIAAAAAVLKERD